MHNRTLAMLLLTLLAWQSTARADGLTADPDTPIVVIDPPNLTYPPWWFFPGLTTTLIVSVLATTDNDAAAGGTGN